jgi:hypothetical protein
MLISLEGLHEAYKALVTSLMERILESGYLQCSEQRGVQQLVAYHCFLTHALEYKQGTKFINLLQVK